MSLRQLPTLLSFSIGVMLLTLSCGGKKIDVSIETIPERPVVITAPISLDEDGDGETDETIEAPWVRVQMRVSNNSDSTVTIVTYKFTVKGVGVDGLPISQEYEIDPEDLVFLNPNVPAGTTDTTNVYIFLEGLPESRSFVYTIKVEAEGWLGTTASPEDRLENVFDYTSTQ